ncbi:hypothetical protein [Actinoplanes sp. NBRC 101535]|uniref:hypothetical protein n=1 Tax=Actinoplanes sp. NBRC 101535 TaxID=3032196 RepID=UPI0024A065A9|nr:hypothetical protein [Actinoplanes sp. NBRC 101535]GLY05038.1 hypothetical protein Acsp01_54170 [Actinoplanes sp. NBRC 101535]
MVLSAEEAHQKAENFLDLNVRPQMSFEVVILDDYIKDEGDSWLFPYNGKGYIEEDRLSEIMAGNTPIRVFKANGETGFDRRG